MCMVTHPWELNVDYTGDDRTPGLTMHDTPIHTRVEATTLSSSSLHNGDASSRIRYMVIDCRPREQVGWVPWNM